MTVMFEEHQGSSCDGAGEEREGGGTRDGGSGSQCEGQRFRDTPRVRTFTLTEGLNKGGT